MTSSSRYNQPYIPVAPLSFTKPKHTHKSGLFQLCLSNQKLAYFYQSKREVKRKVATSCCLLRILCLLPGTQE